MASNEAGVAVRVLRATKPATLMVLVQAVYAGVCVLYQLATNDEMSTQTLVAYRTLFAAAFTLLLALSTETRESVPKITCRVLFQASFCGLLMVVYQYAYVESLRKTSPTIVSAITNLTPAATFVLALICREEKLHLARVGGQAKLAGTLVGICGAMVITFYKGAEIPMWSTNINLAHHHPSRSSLGISVFGVVLAFSCCFASAVSLTFQANLSKRYSYHNTSTALTNLMAAGISVVFALCVEKDSSQWKLGPDVKLLTVLYSGILASGMAAILTTWCINMKGPIFATAFSPLVTVFVAIAGALLLDERVHLGSIVGAVLIGFGLFMGIWGKGQEANDAANPTHTLEHPITETIEVAVVRDSTASKLNLVEPLELSDMKTIDAAVDT